MYIERFYFCLKYFITLILKRIHKDAFQDFFIKIIICVVFFVIYEILKMNCISFREIVNLYIILHTNEFQSSLSIWSAHWFLLQINTFSVTKYILTLPRVLCIKKFPTNYAQTKERHDIKKCPCQCNVVVIIGCKSWRVIFCSPLECINHLQSPTAVTLWLF